MQLVSYRQHHASPHRLEQRRRHQPVVDCSRLCHQLQRSPHYVGHGWISIFELSILRWFYTTFYIISKIKINIFFNSDRRYIKKIWVIVLQKRVSLRKHIFIENE